jgi:hypothetical protein
MRCEDARAGLMEADRAILEGIGDDPLAKHVTTCPRCGGVARLILREEEALEGSLAIEAPRLDLDVILARALVAGRQEAPVTDSRGSRILRYLGPRGLLPLAAAAATMVLMLGRPPTLPGPPYSPPATSQGVDVQTPSETNVVVLETRNPDIVVVWLF